MRLKQLVTVRRFFVAQCKGPHFKPNSNESTSSRRENDTPKACSDADRRHWGLNKRTRANPLIRDLAAPHPIGIV